MWPVKISEASTERLTTTTTTSVPSTTTTTTTTMRVDETNSPVILVVCSLPQSTTVYVLNVHEYDRGAEVGPRLEALFDVDKFLAYPD